MSIPSPGPWLMEVNLAGSDVPDGYAAIGTDFKAMSSRSGRDTAVG